MHNSEKTTKKKDVIDHLSTGREVIVHFKEVFNFKMNPQRITALHNDVAVVEDKFSFHLEFDNPAIDFWELK